MKLAMNAQVPVPDAPLSRASAVAPAFMELGPVELLPMPEAGRPLASVVAPKPFKVEVEAHLQALEP